LNSSGCAAVANATPYRQSSPALEWDSPHFGY
jgi:hypothetical protein